MPQDRSPQASPRSYLSPAAGVIAALRHGRSSTLQLVGDSTGDATDEWFALLGRTLGARNRGFSVAWRPWNDTAQWYDPPTFLQVGSAGQQYATFAAGGVSYAAASIVGDLVATVKLRPVSWGSGAVQTMAGKYDPTGNQRGWQFNLTATGKLQFLWSANGTATTAVATTSAVPFAAGATGWVRVSFDVDNGAAGNTATFATSPDGITWTTLDAPVITAGVTTLFDNATTPYQVASIQGFSATNPLAADVFWVEILNGLTGPSVVPPLVSDWDQATFVTPSNTMLMGGSPTILLVAGCIPGQNIAYFDNATRRPKLLAPQGQDLILLSTGHNESAQLTAQTYIAAYAAWVANVKTLLPGVPICPVTQNPAKAPTTANDIAARAARGAAVMTWSRSQAGVYGLDTYPAFTDLAGQVNADGVHPVPAGSASWADYVDDALFAGA